MIYVVYCKYFVLSHDSMGSLISRCNRQQRGCEDCPDYGELKEESYALKLLKYLLRKENKRRIKNAQGS